MQVIPVMDLLDGLTVRAYRGERNKYRPMESPLVNSPHPVKVAKALLYVTGGSDLYVADLNAIQDMGDNLEVLRKVREETMATLWIDAGTGSFDEVLYLMSEIPSCKVVVGSETLESSDEFERISKACQEDRMIFSLDMKKGSILTRSESPLAGKTLEEGIDLLRLAGWRRVILLTLDGVGTGRGLPLKMYERATRMAPDMSFYGGGGFKSKDELFDMKKSNMAGVLVATALHEGWIIKKDIKELA